jgi:hypothetical protein
VCVADYYLEGVEAIMLVNRASADGIGAMGKRHKTPTGRPLGN